MKRNRFKVFDRHLFGQRDHVAELVYLAHGIVEDGGDDPAMAMAGRSRITLAETKAAYEGLALFVEREFQAHTVRIVLSASKAVVFLQFDVGGFVAVNLPRHGEFYRGEAISTQRTES